MEITKEIQDSFRLDFNGQFSDPVKWPDTVIADALCEADGETGGSGWGGFVLECNNFKRRGMFYYAAAWLTTFYGPTTVGGIGGEARLNVAAKSVGDESIQYRVAAMMDAGNDFLTFTVYGQQFYRLRKRAGMGARAV